MRVGIYYKALPYNYFKQKVVPDCTEALNYLM